MHPEQIARHSLTRVLPTFAIDQFGGSNGAKRRVVGPFLEGCHEGGVVFGPFSRQSQLRPPHASPPPGGTSHLKRARLFQNRDRFLQSMKKDFEVSSASATRAVIELGFALIHPLRSDSRFVHSASVECCGGLEPCGSASISIPRRAWQCNAQRLDFDTAALDAGTVPLTSNRTQGLTPLCLVKPVLERWW